AIDGPGLPSARVDDRKSPPAASARQKPREQRPTAAARLDTAGPPVSVGGELSLVAFKLRPVDVAFMVILQRNLASLERSAVAVSLAQTSVDDRCALLAFAVGIGAGIEGVLEHGDDITIADRQPFKGDQPFAVGGSREVDLILGYRQQHLPRTAQLAESGENQTDGFPDAPVGIEAEADLAMPDVATLIRNSPRRALARAASSM